MTYLEFNNAIHKISCPDKLRRMVADMSLSLYVIARPAPLNMADQSVMAASAEGALRRAENALNKRS